MTAFEKFHEMTCIGERIIEVEEEVVSLTEKVLIVKAGDMLSETYIKRCKRQGYEVIIKE